MRPVHAALSAVAALVVIAPSAPPAAATPPPTRLLITGYEWNLTLSRSVLNPGPAIVQFRNTGEDPHDLVLQRSDLPHEFKRPELGPGGLETFNFRFRKGVRYRLWCSLEGHEAAGMAAGLRVRPRRIG